MNVGNIIGFIQNNAKVVAAGTCGTLAVLSVYLVVRQRLIENWDRQEIEQYTFEEGLCDGINDLT